MPLLELEVAKGRRVWVDAIHSERTYTHVYEGLPTASSNDRYLAGFPERIERIFHGPFPCFVIPPERDTSTHVTPSGEPAEKLPACWIAALCYGDGMGTCLTLIWFQDELVPPFSDRVREQLATVDWDAHSQEFCP